MRRYSKPSRVCIAIVFVATAASAATCESLAALSLAQTHITAAQSVSVSDYTPPGASQPLHNLPAFCRLVATLTPSKDSNIEIEVWLPDSGWNGKLQSVGNGGWSGAINYGGLASAVTHGYASASTDTGHAGGSAEFALGHPEKLIDFAYRSEHEMTVKAKAIVAAFYGNAPKRSYWNGCSSGGKQGLKEAQKFPEDYDGIIAGAPANNWVGLLTSDMVNTVAMLKNPASVIPPAKLTLLHAAAVQACDALDGVADGLIGDLTKCKFDPARLLCRGSEGESCLTAAQVEAAKTIYGPLNNPHTHNEIFPGLEPGSELGWTAFTGPKPFSIPYDYFRFVILKEPNWDFHSFNLAREYSLAEKQDHANVLKAIDPDLKRFFGRGGKLILYHGWADNLIAPLNSVNYYKSVLAKVGSKTADDSIRLYMAPGMGHCAGGDGPSVFDMVDPLEQWVEQGRAPDRVIASHRSDGRTNRTRPLCPYPQVAKYKGSGNTDDAANFVCAQP